MSTTTIQNSFSIDGVPTDVTSAVLSNAAGTFGVRRTDTLATVVAAGTAMAKQSTGVYSYTFTDPAAGLTYNYWMTFVYQGETFRIEKNQSMVAADSGSSYLTLGEANTLAGALPGLAKFKAADDSTKTAALLLATMDVDNSGPWQGRKFDGAQVLAFPRIAYQGSGFGAQGSAYFGQSWAGPGDVVWEWDATNNVAIVPNDVKRATLFQADEIISGKLAKVLADLYTGVLSKAVGSLSVQYRDPALLMSAGGLGALTLRADQFMRRFRLKQGRIL